MEPSAPSFRIVLTTVGSDRKARELAEALVDRRLAACVNVIGPIQSIYRWQGAIEQAEERQLVIKTTAGRVAALEARLGELHPYEVPELLVMAVTGGGARYLSWLAESTGEQAAP
jgi:periplasmic divalent cation tolerance protein